MKDLLLKKRIDSNLNAHARTQIIKLFIEPCHISGKVYTEHNISNLLSVMHVPRIE